MIRFVVLGVSIGLGLIAAVWMVAAGVRTDETGTTLTDAELIIGWSGLATAVVLLFASSASIWTDHRR